MKTYRNYLLAGASLVILALVMLAPSRNAAQIPPTTQLISQGSLLAGLAPGALFPFVDTTPHKIVKAHIAITDATSACGGASPAAPANIQVLAGVAGGSLVNVMTAATNTGIGSASQCVFHVTIAPGIEGVPTEVTDIVVVNGNANSALTGVNTVTVSATVR